MKKWNISAADWKAETDKNRCVNDIVIKPRRLNTLLYKIKIYVILQTLRSVSSFSFVDAQNYHFIPRHNI